MSRVTLSIWATLAVACGASNAAAEPDVPPGEDRRSGSDDGDARGADGAVGDDGHDGPCEPAAWPLWDAYAGHFIEDDGRVVDRTDGARTVSEGQAYALFFALVADDRERFGQILDWTVDNLARGDLAAHLPAWLWGERPDGAWGVIDENAASDADLWIAYALLEAGRLWEADAYTETARAVMRNVVARETVTLPELGPILLPGPVGFALDDDRWRLNPSYLPLFQLRRLADADPEGPWEAMIPVTLAMLEASEAHGLQPDWIGYDADNGWIVDPVSGAEGSYDAIRVYLWGGLLPADEPHRDRVLRATRGLFAAYAQLGRVPERVDTRDPDLPGTNGGPVGFIAALLPDAAARGEDAARDALAGEIAQRSRGELYDEPPRYYDHNLLMFGLGHTAGRYRFDDAGRLVPRWKEAPCSASP